jgi:ATP-dependent DNA helicase RecG
LAEHRETSRGERKIVNVEEIMGERLLPVERLRASITQGESQFREFKSAVEGPPALKVRRPAKNIRRDICETLVAFANADGGELYVGVEDDGTVTGIPHGVADVASLVEATRDGIHRDTPLPPPLISRIDVDGKLVIAFSTSKSTDRIILTSDGRCLQRRDRESVPVAFHVIEFERREQLSRSADRQFVDGPGVDVLDPQLLATVGKDIAPGFSSEKLLQLLDLADFDGVTVKLRQAALLLFAREVNRWHPRSQVRVLRVAGTELKTGREYNVVRDDVISGNVLTLLVTSWEAVRPHLVQTRLESSGLFEERIAYPEAACREALTNAIAHRDYNDQGRGVEVYVFDDRMEVKSPGSLLSTITVEDLRELKGVHESRNPIMTRVLREVGYMREIGEGVRRIFLLMKESDLVEPEIRSEVDSFSITLHHESIFSERDQRWLAGFDLLHLTPEEMKVVLLGRNGTAFSMQQVWDLLGLVDTEHWRSLLEGMQLKGLVVTTTGRKDRGRQVPRFKVRDPRDCQRDIAELVQAIGSRRRLTTREVQAIRERLGAGNYFASEGRPLARCLVQLHLVDAVSKVTRY